MMFQPTNTLTGEQICAGERSAREAVLAAYAVCEMGDIDADTYEDKYGHLLICTPSHSSGYCIWSAGNWQMYSLIEVMA